MSNLFRCKACGLVLEESKIGKKCPACGVPSGAFEPFKSNIAEKRRKLLDLHIHPIIVHFPQAFTIILPWLIAGSYLFTSSMGKQMMITAQFLIMILPFSVVIAIISGIIDGILRFKKLSTQYLIIKMITALLLLIFTSCMAYIDNVYGVLPSTMIPFMAFNVLSIVCQVILGTIGVKLMYATMPG